MKNYSCTEIILNHELLLMEQLNFHITVHNPWRPVEGLIIDIKTRLLPGSSNVQKPVLTSEYTNFFHVFKVSCPLAGQAELLSLKWAKMQFSEPPHPLHYYVIYKWSLAEKNRWKNLVDLDFKIGCWHVMNWLWYQFGSDI